MSLREQVQELDTLIERLERDLSEAIATIAALRQENEDMKFNAIPIADRLEALAAEDTADVFAVAGAVLEAQRGLNHQEVPSP